MDHEIVAQKAARMGRVSALQSVARTVGLVILREDSGILRLHPE
jgi:hypothetical protein